VADTALNAYNLKGKRIQATPTVQLVFVNVAQNDNGTWAALGTYDLLFTFPAANRAGGLLGQARGDPQRKIGGYDHDLTVDEHVIGPVPDDGFTDGSGVKRTTSTDTAGASFAVVRLRR
jgi:hypothetical protein